MIKVLVVALLLCSASFGLTPSIAQAQELPELQLQRFRPAPGVADYLNLHSTKATPHLEWNAGFYLDWANNPLKVPSFDQRTNAVVESQTTLSLLFALGILDWMEVGVLLPVTLYQTEGNLSPVLPQDTVEFEPLGAAGINDPTLTLKFQIFDVMEEPFGLAIVVGSTVPVGMRQRFVSDRAYSGHAVAGIERLLFRGVRVGANAGYRYRRGSREIRDAIISDEVIWGVGAAIPILKDNLDLIVEIDGAIGVASKPVGREGIRSSEVPAEAKAAVRYQVLDEWTLTTGIGGALNDGVGSPDVRLFIGFGRQWTMGTRWDYYWGFSRLYALNRCPRSAADYDGFSDIRGCERYDSDGDGVPDYLDHCPDTPRGYAVDARGCPIDDLDADGIVDLKRLCPHAPDYPTDFVDEDGCPYDPNDRVRLTRDRIIITEQVFFDTNRDTIMQTSFDVLDEVAQVILDNPQILRIRVEGHTDSRGGAEYNLDLSQRRAESVRRYLIDKGVAQNRLDAVGYGLTRPIADNDTAEGRATNRRVEFTILEMREF